MVGRPQSYRRLARFPQPRFGARRRADRPPRRKRPRGAACRAPGPMPTRTRTEPAAPSRSRPPARTPRFRRDPTPRHWPPASRRPRPATSRPAWRRPGPGDHPEPERAVLDETGVAHVGCQSQALPEAHLGPVEIALGPIHVGEVVELQGHRPLVVEPAVDGQAFVVQLASAPELALHASALREHVKRSPHQLLVLERLGQGQALLRVRPEGLVILAPEGDAGQTDMSPCRAGPIPALLRDQQRLLVQRAGAALVALAEGEQPSRVERLHPGGRGLTGAGRRQRRLEPPFPIRVPAGIHPEGEQGDGELQRVGTVTRCDEPAKSFRQSLVLGFQPLLPGAALGPPELRRRTLGQLQQGSRIDSVHRVSPHAQANVRRGTRSEQRAART